MYLMYLRYLGYLHDVSDVARSNESRLLMTVRKQHMYQDSIGTADF